MKLGVAQEARRAAGRAGSGGVERPVAAIAAQGLHGPIIGLEPWRAKASENCGPSMDFAPDGISTFSLRLLLRAVCEEEPWEGVSKLAPAAGGASS